MCDWRTHLSFESLKVINDFYLEPIYSCKEFALKISPRVTMWDSIISLFISSLISVNGRGEGEREHLVNFWVRMHKKVRPGLKLYLV